MTTIDKVRRAYVDSSIQESSYQDVDESYALVNVCVSSGCYVYGDEFDPESGTLEPMARGLEISDRAIRFQRLHSRAPVLDNHRADGSIHDQLGSVETAWISSERGLPELFATIRLSKVSAREKELAAKIKHKIINNVSVGADIYETEDLTRPGSMRRTLATDWEPVEVSLVPIPADLRAVICSLDQKPKKQYSRKKTNTTKGGTMNRELRAGMPEDLKKAIKNFMGDETTMTKDMEGEVMKILGEGTAKEEMADGKEKEKMAKEDYPKKEGGNGGGSTGGGSKGEYEDKEKMAGDAKEKMKDGKKKEEMAEDKKKEEMKRSTEGTATELFSLMKEYLEEHQPAIKSNRSRSSHSAYVVEDHRRTYIERSRNQISDAIAEKIGAPGMDVSKDNEFRNMPVSSMFRELLYREGNHESRNWSPEQIFDEIQTRRIQRSGGGGPFQVTSDLANLFSTSVNKSVQKSYEYMRGQQTFDPFVRRQTVKDFQTQEEVSLGEFGKLQETPPGATSPITPISDDKEEWRIKSYTNTFRITRQGFVNDNTGELESVLTSGASAADLESDLVYEQLHSGTVGGSSWYSAGRRNLTTGAPLGADANPYAGLKAIYEGLARQTGLDVDSPLNLTFKYLVVPVTLYYAAAQSQGTLNGIVVPTKTGDLNPFAAMYQIVKEPRLDLNSTSTYYGIAGEANMFRKFLVLGTLSEGGTPKIKFKEGFEDDVLAWKLTHDVGAKILDYRLAHRVTA